MVYSSVIGPEMVHHFLPAMTASSTPHPIYAELRQKSDKKRRDYERKLFNDACRQIADHMDGIEVAELFRSELTKELLVSWRRVWDTLNRERTATSVEFKVKKATYWLTRDF